MMLCIYQGEPHEKNIIENPSPPVLQAKKKLSDPMVTIRAEGTICNAPALNTSCCCCAYRARGGTNPAM